MKNLCEYIMERRAMPVLHPDKLRVIWEKVKAKLGDEFDQDLLASLDHTTLNEILWKLETKYNLGIMR